MDVLRMLVFRQRRLLVGSLSYDNRIESWRIGRGQNIRFALSGLN